MMQNRRRIALELVVGLCPLMACTMSVAAPSFSAGIQTGSVQIGSVQEASGIAASRMNPNVLWTHNDSGDSARVFAMTTAGTNLGIFSVTGAGSNDWEDIAVGPGPNSGTQYLYIGDIGDNGGGRSSVAVYRVPEPVVSDTQSPVNTSLDGAVRFTFRYPDGARDAESLFVDPLTKDLYIISKRENPKHLYRAAYPQSTTGTTTLELMGAFLTDSTWLTAADISPNGNEIITRSTDTTSGRMYLRPPGGTIADAFQTTPVTIPLRAEPQGEAIGFDPNGHGYYTVSEGSNRPVYYFDRLPPSPSAMYWDADGVAAGSRVTTGTGLGGSGTWNAADVRWYNGSAELAWVGGNDAVFWGNAGTVTLAAGQTANSLTFKSDGYILAGGSLTMVGPSMTTDAASAATISAVVAGSAGLVKSGGGTLTLSSANSYTGGTTIAEGILLVMNTTGSGTGTGQVDVSAGARLGGIGTLQGDVFNSGTVAPGIAAGVLHLGGAYTQSIGGQLECGIASLFTYDRLDVTGVAALAGTLTVTLVSGFSPALGDSFDIVSAASFGGSTFADAVLPALPVGWSWKLDYRQHTVTLWVSLSGDFNGDGTVDTADYVRWRNGVGAEFTLADYATWRSQFGQAVNAGGRATALWEVPEPVGWSVALPALVGAMLAIAGRCTPRGPAGAGGRSFADRPEERPF